MTVGLKNALGLTTQETIDMAMGIMDSREPRSPTSKAAIKAGITTGNYLYGYPLEAPSKKLYFIEDAIRRRIPRWVNPEGGVAAHWKKITAINSGNIKAGVSEGAVATALTPTTAEVSANYKTLNQYHDYSDESRIMGRRFEDVPGLGMLMTLQSLMIQEDRYLLGGNQNALGEPTGVTAAASSTAGTFLATDYYIVVSALTIHGWLNAAKGHVSADAADETDGGQCNSGVALAATVNKAVDLSWTDVPGAFAYNIYIGTTSFAAAEYHSTVFANSVTITSPTAAGTGVPNSADQTADTLGYSGIVEQLTYGGVAATGCYYKDCAGAALTGNGAGGVTEIEAMLKSMWDNYRVGPTVGFINAQESESITKLTIGSSTSNAVRININQGEKNEFTAGSAVNAYWNKFTQQMIHLITSVHVPAGKSIFVGETVPYPNSETPNNLEVELQQEYYGEEFARTQRKTPVGVTCIGALKLYLPGACGIIANCQRDSK